MTNSLSDSKIVTGVLEAPEKGEISPEEVVKHWHHGHCDKGVTDN